MACYFLVRMSLRWEVFFSEQWKAQKNLDREREIWFPCEKRWFIHSLPGCGQFDMKLGWFPQPWWFCWQSQNVNDDFLDFILSFLSYKMTNGNLDDLGRNSLREITPVFNTTQTGTFCKREFNILASRFGNSPHGIGLFLCRWFKVRMTNCSAGLIQTLSSWKKVPLLLPFMFSFSEILNLDKPLCDISWAKLKKTRCNELVFPVFSIQVSKQCAFPASNRNKGPNADPSCFITH